MEIVTDITGLHNGFQMMHTLLLEIELPFNKLILMIRLTLCGLTEFKNLLQRTTSSEQVWMDFRHIFGTADIFDQHYNTSTTMVRS